mmetsp:Transcript_24471/g.70241  ORF Transcript_24471/g.70241 Transcript_24471/m.70241 type:complete len:227 (-) Transcript_24471:101-781(-)
MPARGWRDSRMRRRDSGPSRSAPTQAWGPTAPQAPGCAPRAQIPRRPCRCRRRPSPHSLLAAPAPSARWLPRCPELQQRAPLARQSAPWVHSETLSAMVAARRHRHLSCRDSSAAPRRQAAWNRRGDPTTRAAAPPAAMVAATAARGPRPPLGASPGPHSHGRSSVGTGGCACCCCCCGGARFRLQLRCRLCGPRPGGRLLPSTSAGAPPSPGGQKAMRRPPSPNA